MDEPKYLNYKGASAYLLISQPSLRRHVMNGAITYMKVGKRVLFKRTDLDAFMESHRVIAKDSE